MLEGWNIGILGIGKLEYRANDKIRLAAKIKKE